MNLLAEMMSFSIDCFKDRPIISIFNGLIFCSIINLLVSAIGLTAYVDISMPIAAIIILMIGPILAINLYVVASEHNQKVKGYEKDDTIVKESTKAVLFVNFCLLILMLLFIMFIPSIYAIATDSIVFIDGAVPMANEFLENKVMLAGAIIWSFLMGWIAFSISWFSYPMIISNRVGGAVAIIYSIKMSYSHFPLMLSWASIVSLAILASLFSPYFIGFIITMPILAYATFDCNRILSREIKDCGADGDSYQEKLNNYTNSI